jgi:hypothetical protein
MQPSVSHLLYSSNLDLDSLSGVATKDDRIPLSQPILKRNGKWEDFIPITKGSYIHIPIEALNTSANIWGPDAHEFKQVYLTNKLLRYLTDG